MPRFAVLSHDHPFPHWDFLLEQGSACRTWRLLTSPDSQGEIPAEALPDHRLLYLDYEGPVSGDRGIVSCWDVGTFEWLVEEAAAVEVKLSGRKLNCIAQLIHKGHDSWAWRMEKS